MPFTFNDDDRALKEFRSEEAERLAETLSERHGVGYVNLSGIPIESDALRLFSEEDARSFRIAPFQKVGKLIKIAVLSPADEKTRSALEDLRTRGFDTEVYMVSIFSLEKAWSRYKDVTETTIQEAGIIDVSPQTVEEIGSKDETAQETRKRLTQQFLPSRPVTELITLILETAIAEGASDIHIEPQEGDVQLRFRVDGILVPVLNFETGSYQRIISRIKILSGLKLNIVSEPQDGRFSVSLGDAAVEIRVSLIPGAFGESVVMRLLNPDAANVSIDKLGMDSILKEMVLKELSKPNGLILTTGPTGSGKTTALYAFLKHVYEPGIKIITIENPVEYRLAGIVQTQVDKERGYDFHDGLTSSLRQDPDVIMVGEIRDSNTAKTAVQASLTGHLVFSTLHTNDAAGSIPRMRDLGVREDVLGSSLNLILAQRLVRKLKADTKIERPLTERERTMIETTMVDVEPTRWRHLYERGTIFDPRDGGSDHTDYEGRTGIYEGVVVDESVEDMIRMQHSPHDIDKAGRLPYNILSLKQHGILNVLNGVTDIGELERVVSLQ